MYKEDENEDWSSASVVGALDDNGEFEDWSSATSRSLTSNEKRRIADTIVRSSQETDFGASLARRDADYQKASEDVKNKLKETSFIDEVSAMLPFESLQTQGGKELNQLREAQDAAERRAGGVPISEAKLSKNPLDWIQAGADAYQKFTSPTLALKGAVDRVNEVKKRQALESIYTDEEFTAYTRDAAAEDWDRNEKGWHVRSDGEFAFSPGLLKDREKFSAALKDAKIPENRANAALELFDNKAAEDRAGLIELAKETPTFQKFASKPENQGKSDEEIYSAFESDKTWLDWVASNTVSIPKESAKYVAGQLAGAAFAASYLTDAKADSATSKVGRAIQEWSSNLDPYDVRYSNTLGQTIAQFVPQIAIQVGTEVGLRRIGIGGKAASQAITALSAGAQIGAENYRTVFEANKDQYGVDEAHEMAMEAFKNSVPLGVSELLSLDVLLSKAPKGKVWAVAKNVASALAEVGTEQFQNSMSNAINKDASAAYVEPQSMGLEESAEMAAGTSLVELAVGGLQRRARNRAKETVDKTTDTLRKAADTAAASGAPETAKVMADLAAKNAEQAPQKVQDTAAQILEEMEEADDDSGDGSGPSAGTGITSDEQQSDITEPTPPPLPTEEAPTAAEPTPPPLPTEEVETPADPVNLRDIVIASGIPEEAADVYISNLKGEGLSDDQIREIADNTRLQREEAAQKNQADAESARELARRARAGDKAARAQLEQQRGINTAAPEVTTPAQTPALEVAAETSDPTPIAATNSGAVTEGVSATPPPTEVSAPESVEAQQRISPTNLAVETEQPTDPVAESATPEATPQQTEPTVTTAEQPTVPISKLQQKRDQDPEEFDSLDPESQLSDLPATEAIELLRQVGSTYEAPAIEGDETFSDYLERTGVSIYEFDTRPTTLNEKEGRYIPEGPDPFQGIVDLAAGRANPTDFSPVQASVSDATPEEADRARKAQQTEEFYRNARQSDQQQTDAPTGTELTNEQVFKAPVKMEGVKGSVSGKRLPIREVPTGETDENGAPVVRVIPGFVNEPSVMAETLAQNRGVERVYVPDEDVDSLDPEEIFVKRDDKGTYVVAARHKKYGVVYADTGLTETGASLEELHEPTRQKNSQAQLQGKRAKRLAKEAGTSVDEVVIPEMTGKFSKRVYEAPISTEEQDNPQKVAATVKRIQDKAQALSGESVKSNDGRIVTIDPELADRIGVAATNLYFARLRGVDKKGKFKDAAGLVADIKKKVLPKLKKRAGGRSGVSLDQSVEEGGSTVGELIGGTNQNLDAMGYPDVPLETQAEQQADAPTPGPSTVSPQTVAEPQLKSNSYADISAKALAEAEKELADLDSKEGTKNLAIWKETVAMLQAGKKKKDLTPSRLKIVKQVESKLRARMADLISEQSAKADLKRAKSTLSAESKAKAITSQEQKALIKTQLNRLIDWNGGATESKFDIKRMLRSIAEDPKQPELVKIVSKYLANSNIDFSQVEFEPLADLQKDKSWAGLYTSGSSARTGKIQINVGDFHRGSLGQTVVHEALHHAAFHKLRPSYQRTGVERDAYRDLNKILTHIRRLVVEPEQGRTLSQEARKIDRGDDMFYGLTDIDELFTETLTNTRFAVWMSTQAPLPNIGLKNTNIFRNLYEQVKQLFKNLIGGQNVRPDSLLSQAMDNILALAQDPQDDAKIQAYRAEDKGASRLASKAALNAAAVDNPLGFEFKTQQAIRGMLDQNKRGALKGLTASPDGTVPWENLMAKLTKAFSAEEADLVLPALESMVRQGRVNVTEAAQALQTIADARARVTVLSAENAETDQTRPGIIHQLDSMYPDWEQDDSQYIDDPIFMGLLDELDSMDRGKIKETESATARFKQVNPKPLDEMDDAGDIVVEDSGRKVFGEAMHFPTRKNVVGFGRKYTETLPNGEEATFVFEVQSDWASTVRKAGDQLREGQGDQFEEDWEGNVRNPKRDVERASPLLSVYENLVLKAAIQDALAKGQTKLIITDAETAMMTEQHDKYAAPAAWYVVNGESATYRDTKEAAEKEVAQLRAAPIEDGGNPNARLEYREAGRPTQEPGMRAAYDPANGRLHNIMRKLTGDRGQRVDLGRHQNAKRVVSIPSEVVNRLRAEGLTDQEIQDKANEGSADGSPVFKNLDGTPKTNITGIVYDLTPILENQEKVRALFASPVNPSAAPNPRTAELEEIIQDVVGSIRTPIRAANLKGHPAQARMNANGDLEILYDAEAIAIETENFTEEETVESVRKLIGHENAHIAALINDYKTADAQGRVGREKIEAFHDELMTDEMRQQTADAYVRRYDGMTDAEYQAARQEFLADKMAVAGEYKRMFTERYLTGESYEDFLSNLARKTGDKFADIVRGIADYLIGRIRMLSARYQMVNDPRLAAVLMQDIRMLKNLDNGTNGLLGDRVTGLNVLNASSVDPVRINTQQSMPTFGGKMVGRIDLDNLSKIPENDPTLKVVHNEAPIGAEVIAVTDFKGLMENRKNNSYTTPENWARFKGRNTFYLVKTGRELGSDELKAMGVDERFASKAQIQRMKKGAGGWKASGFFGQGLMDKAVWNRVEQQNAELRGANFRVGETAKKFDRLVKKHKPNSATLQAALGSTDNVLTDAQYDQWKGMTKAAKKETDPTKRKAAMAAADAFRLSQVRANNVQKQADRKAALSQLPQELQDVVESMRTQIDKLSKVMISEGLIGSNLQATLGANMGVYLNRSYEVFDNPEWSDFILTDQSLESQRIRNNAAKLFRSQLVAEEARKIRRDAKLNNQPVPTRQDALAAAQATVTDNDVSLLMQEYLRVGDDAAVALLGGRLPGKADTSIIKLRGQIPREVRELWGEYKDTGVNYAKTYIKMASFIANHQFQKDFYEMGMTRSTPFLWKEGVSQGKRPDHWVEVYKGLSDSPNPNPMAGVYGPQIIVEAFKEANEKYKQAPINQLVTALTGFAMASKTIYNPPQTYVRNFLGNGLIMFSQGYVVTDVAQLGFLKRFGKSAVTTGDRLIGLRPERSEDVTDYIERLTKLGVMGDNVKASVIKELQSVVFDKNPSAAFGNKLQGAFNALKSGNQRLLDAYQAGDDFWKILAFESERSTFAKAFPKATPESLDRMAADRVRAVVPTYSMIPKGVQDLVKKQPYLAPFISWTSEISRTFLNTWIVAAQDISSGNRVLRRSGLKRMLSAAAGQGLLVVAANAIRDFFGVSDEEEEALRRFLPEWQVDALLALTGKSKGKLTFWDLSYLNPYSVLQEPVTAFGDEYKKTGSLVDATLEGLQKLMDPWTSEQLLFGAVMDVARGYTKEGFPIYEEADSKWNNFKSGASRLVQAVTPGAVNLPIRISKALAGEVSSGGKAYSVEDELKGAILGQKPAEVDVLQRFQNKNLTKFKLLSSSASNLATKEYRTRGTPDLANIRENYAQSNNARMQAFKEVREDVEALEKLGVTKSQAIQVMKARGVPEDDIRQIIAGKYKRRFPGKSSLENAVGLPDFKGRLQALIQARDSYPEVQDFTVESPTDQ